MFIIFLSSVMIRDFKHTDRRTTFTTTDTDDSRQPKEKEAFRSWRDGSAMKRIGVVFQHLHQAAHN